MSTGIWIAIVGAGILVSAIIASVVTKSVLKSKADSTIGNADEKARKIIDDALAAVGTGTVDTPESINVDGENVIAATITMKDGKVFKARKALRAISSSDSPFAEMARKALKKDL